MHEQRILVGLCDEHHALVYLLHGGSFWRNLDLDGVADDIFLTQVRRERRSVTIFLMNGFQMRGYVTGFDSFTVVLTTDGKQQVIYKHAISTIVPERPIPLYDSTGEGMSAPVPRPQ